MPLSDEQLMLDIRRGSASAFELLVRRWDRRMLVFLHRCVGDRSEAEDLRQELFLRVYQKSDSYRRGGRFNSWLYRIAANLAIDKHARKQRPSTQTLDDASEDIAASSEPVLQFQPPDSRSAAAWGEWEDRVFEALQRIPNAERVVLVLRHFENLSFKEIAETMNEPESTIKSRVYRGLQSMRAELKRLGLMEKDLAPSA